MPRTDFMFKCILLLFCVPLLATFNIEFDMGPLKSAVAAYQPKADPVEVEHMQQAAEAISSMAKAQGAENDPELQRTMSNINTMIAKQQTR